MRIIYSYGDVQLFPREAESDFFVGCCLSYSPFFIVYLAVYICLRVVDAFIV